MERREARGKDGKGEGRENTLRSPIQRLKTVALMNKTLMGRKL
jgi:hypothetical protein